MKKILLIVLSEYPQKNLLRCSLKENIFQNRHSLDLIVFETFLLNPAQKVLKRMFKNYKNNFDSSRNNLSEICSDSPWRNVSSNYESSADSFRKKKIWSDYPWKNPTKIRSDTPWKKISFKIDPDWLWANSSKNLQLWI